jgi:hypothetical protein
MLDTDITLECIPVDDPDGGLKYQITATCTVAGELPDTYLFVYDVVVPADAKQDAFVRVANPYDLEHVVVGRAAALAAGVTRFRTNEFVVRYVDLQLAVQAKTAIGARIDTAILLWYTFKTDFESTTPPSVDPHPTTDQELLQTLTDVYKAATAAREAAEAAVVTDTAAVTAAIAAAATAAQLVQIYARETTFCQTGRITYWEGATGVKAGVTALAAASRVFFNDQIAWYNLNNPDHVVYPTTPSDPVWLPFHTELQHMEAALSSWGISEPNVALLDSTLSAFCVDASTGYSIAVTAKAVADVAVATAQTAKQKADADLASAIAAEDAALAAIKTVCPTFDPSSV